jgi:hypothetical protein
MRVDDDGESRVSQRGAEDINATTDRQSKDRPAMPVAGWNWDFRDLESRKQEMIDRV